MRIGCIPSGDTAAFKGEGLNLLCPGSSDRNSETGSVNVNNRIESRHR